MIDWILIQKEYDSGKSYRDLQKEFGISHATLIKAKIRGDFKPLSFIESNLRRGRLKPNRKMTDEERKAVSTRIIELFKRRPELHPNCKVANNRQVMTYPERLAYDWLKSNNIDFIHNAKIGKYFVDFLIGKTAIEIDGERWHSKDSDNKRDSEINSFGVTVLRIKAKDIIKDKDNLILKQAINGKIDQDFLNKFREQISESFKIKHFCKCGGQKDKDASVCLKCENERRLSKLKSQKNILIQTLEDTDYNYRETGRLFGVTDNMIRKRCRALNIPIRKGIFHHPKILS